jgi:hypothetical protein
MQITMAFKRNAKGFFEEKKCLWYCGNFSETLYIYYANINQ